VAQIRGGGLSAPSTTGRASAQSAWATRITDSESSATRRAAIKPAVVREAPAASRIALPGAAFLLVAAFLGLRTLLGAGLAALILGLSLLALAAGVLLVGRGAAPSLPAPPLWTAPPVAAPRPADLATMTVFTTAFMLGRRLAERPRRSDKP
jgi:hypothetical protein